MLIDNCLEGMLGDEVIWARGSRVRDLKISDFLKYHKDGLRGEGTFVT